LLNTFTLYFLSVAGVAPEAVLDRRLDVGLVQIPDRRLASLDLGNYFKAEVKAERWYTSFCFHFSKIFSIGRTMKPFPRTTKRNLVQTILT